MLALEGEVGLGMVGEFTVKDLETALSVTSDVRTALAKVEGED